MKAQDFPDIRFPAIVCAQKLEWVIKVQTRRQLRAAIAKLRSVGYTKAYIQVFHLYPSKVYDEIFNSVRVAK